MTRSRLTVCAIGLAVADYYGISWRELVSDRRTTGIVRPRQVAMWLAREHTVLSLPQIGRRLGGRDHTTVLHACRKIDHLRHSDAELAQELAEIEGILGDTRTPSPVALHPEPDVDPFEVAARTLSDLAGLHRLTVREAEALAHAVLVRQPIEEDDGDPAPAEPVEAAAQEVAPPAPALPVIPPPRGAEAVRMVEEVLKAFRNLESARFSARERAERAAFERALNTLSSHFKTETNHAGH